MVDVCVNWTSARNPVERRPYFIPGKPKIPQNLWPIEIRVSKAFWNHLLLTSPLTKHPAKREKLETEYAVLCNLLFDITLLKDH